MIMKKTQQTFSSIKAAAGPSVVVISATIFVIILFGFLLFNEVTDDFKKKISMDAALSPAAIQLRDIQEREKDTLSSYKMLDEAQGIVQIPIERAVQLIIEESLARQYGMRSQNK
jgi:hypothetical protein